MTELHFNDLFVENLQEMFFEACQKGDVDTVKSLIDEVNLEGTCQNNWRPIHFAAKFGHVEIVKILMDRNVNFRAETDNSIMPIYLAIENGHYEIFELLFSEKDFDFKITDKHVLFASIIFNRKRIFKFILLELLKFYCRKQKSMVSYIMSYVGFTRSEIIPHLLEKFLENEEDDFSLIEELKKDSETFYASSRLYYNAIKSLLGFFPLEFIFEFCKSDIAGILFSIIHKDFYTNNTYQLYFAIKAAIMINNAELIRLMLERKIIETSFLDKTINGNMALLSYAFSFGHIDTIRVYLDFAEKNFNIAKFITFIAFIDNSKFENLCKLFLEYELDLNKKNSSCNNLIHYVCMNGNLNAYRLIVDKVNLEEIDNCHENILHHACKGGNLEIVKDLFSRKLKLNTEKKAYYSPLDYAVEKGHKNIVCFLLDNGVELNYSTYSNTFLIACENGRVEIAKILLHRLEKPIDFKNILPSIHKICSKNDTQLIELILKYYNINFDYIDIYKNNPLMIAIKNNNLEMVKLLIDGFLSEKMYRITPLSNIFSISLENASREIKEHIELKRELYMRTIFREKIKHSSDIEIYTLN